MEEKVVNLKDTGICEKAIAALGQNANLFVSDNMLIMVIYSIFNGIKRWQQSMQNKEARPVHISSAFVPEICTIMDCYIVLNHILRADGFVENNNFISVIKKAFQDDFEARFTGMDALYNIILVTMHEIRNYVMDNPDVTSIVISAEHNGSVKEMVILHDQTTVTDLDEDYDEKEEVFIEHILMI